MSSPSRAAKNKGHPPGPKGHPHGHYSVWGLFSFVMMLAIFGLFCVKTSSDAVSRCGESYKRVTKKVCNRCGRPSRESYPGTPPVYPTQARPASECPTASTYPSAGCGAESPDGDAMLFTGHYSAVQGNPQSVPCEGQYAHGSLLYRANGGATVYERPYGASDTTATSVLAAGVTE